MSDHDALLRAIGEQPEEDTPRLMYADWLEENGDPDRAAFVRTQVALERTPSTDPARYELVRKNVRYHNNFVPHWKALLPRIAGIEWGDFNRGLIEEVLAVRTDAHEAPEQKVARHAATIFAVPGVHILRLRGLGDGTALAGVSELERVRVLKVVGARANPGPLRALLATPHLARLTGLGLDENRADAAVVEDIADGRFPDLTDLWLGGNRIGADGALALAHSPHLKKLTLLDVRDNLLTDRDALTALRRRFGKALKV